MNDDLERFLEAIPSIYNYMPIREEDPYTYIFPPPENLDTALFHVKFEKDQENSAGHYIKFSTKNGTSFFLRSYLFFPFWITKHCYVIAIQRHPTAPTLVLARVLYNSTIRVIFNTGVTPPTYHRLGATLASIYNYRVICDQKPQ